MTESSIDSIRVVELDGALTAFAGRLLWEAGADVVRVVPVGASDPDCATSTAMHAGKRCVRLETPADLDVLCAGADVLLLPTGSLAGAWADQVDEAAIRARNAHLVVIDVSPFGASGPKASWVATDAVVSAAGGGVAANGWADAAPVPAPGEQAWHLAGLNAALAALMAVRRRRSGPGGYVEVAALDAMASSIESAALSYIHCGERPRRTGTAHPLAPHRLFNVADGMLAAGLGGNPRMRIGVIEWINEQGHVVDTDCSTGELLDAAERHAASQTRTAVFHEAQRRRLPWAPVSAIEEVADHDQLRERDALVPVTSISGRQGVVVATPACRPDRRTERHVESPRSVDDLRWPPMPMPGGAEDARSPLDGILVVDMTWVLAGPYATKILADHGARVVKIESSHRPDPTRFAEFSHLSRDAARHHDTSGYFNNFNRGKQSVQLDLRQESGKDALKRVVAEADLVVENFSAGTLDRMGLGYEVLSALNPSIVLVSMSGMGQTGPWANYVSYADAISGLSGLTASMPTVDGRKTAVVYGLADIVAGYHAAYAGLCAVSRAAAEGVGAHVDLSQLEAMASHFGPAMVTATGGPALEEQPIDFVLPCLGADRWIAVSITNDCGWEALVGVLQAPALQSDERWFDHAIRRVHRETLTKALAERTVHLPAEGLASSLQALGVAASAVHDGQDLVEDENQLWARGFYRLIEHPRAGAFLHEGSPIRFDGAPTELPAAAPLLGAQTHAALQELGGFTDAEIAELDSTGVLQ